MVVADTFQSLIEQVAGLLEVTLKHEERCLEVEPAGPIEQTKGISGGSPCPEVVGSGEYLFGMRQFAADPGGVGQEGLAPSAQAQEPELRPGALLGNAGGQAGQP